MALGIMEESVGVYTSNDILADLSINKSMAVFYPIKSLFIQYGSDEQLNSVARAIDVDVDEFRDMLDDPHKIGLFISDNHVDVKSLLVVLYATPYSKWVYSAYYYNGDFVEENNPEE